MPNFGRPALGRIDADRSEIIFKALTETTKPTLVCRLESNESKQVVFEKYVEMFILNLNEFNVLLVHVH